MEIEVVTEGAKKKVNKLRKLNWIFMCQLNYWHSSNFSSRELRFVKHVNRDVRLRVPRPQINNIIFILFIYLPFYTSFIINSGFQQFKFDNHTSKRGGTQ
jgi:hypothetical protein